MSFDRFKHHDCLAFTQFLIHSLFTNLAIAAKIGLVMEVKDVIHSVSAGLKPELRPALFAAPSTSSGQALKGPFFHRYPDTIQNRSSLRILRIAIGHSMADSAVGLPALVG